MWSSKFTITLNFLVDTFADTEAAITAIERVDAMADLPKENALESSKENMPPKEWPQQGLLEFSNVALRYRQGLPLALDGLSFKVPAGKTCGIVGRTGAGKSSITVCAISAWSKSNPETYYLDGVDLGLLGLSDVRGRGMSIIPPRSLFGRFESSRMFGPLQQIYRRRNRRSLAGRSVIRKRPRWFQT